MSEFTAQHTCHTSSISIDASPEVVFPLFTPLGEKLWVDGWDPDFLFPTDGTTQKDMVFTTTHQHEKTLWTLVDYDEVAYHARYARVTPESRFGMVEVKCQAGEGMTTQVTVTYTFTALSESGNAYINQFTEEAYHHMLESWQTLVTNYLAK